MHTVMSYSVDYTSGSSLDGWGGGGGLKRGGADCRRSRPGEGAGEGHPSRPARGYGGALEAPPSGSGALPQKPALFALENYAKLQLKYNYRSSFYILHAPHHRSFI